MKKSEKDKRRQGGRVTGQHGGKQVIKSKKSREMYEF